MNASSSLGLSKIQKQMSEVVKLVGAPTTVVTKAKLTSVGLELSFEDAYPQSDGSVITEETPKKTFKRMPHPDLRAAIHDLKRFVVQLCCISTEAADNIAVTGYAAKDLNGDQPEGMVLAKLRTVDGVFIAVNTPWVKFDSTAFPFAKDMNAALIAAEREVLQYLLGNKCENPHQFQLSFEFGNLVGGE